MRGVDGKRRRGRPKYAENVSKYRFKKQNVPWNLGRDTRESRENAIPSTYTRVPAEDLPVSRTFDFETCHKLRPAARQEEKEFSENIIASVKSLNMLVTMVHQHAKMCTKFGGNNTPKCVIKDSKGLLVYLSINCKFCQLPSIPMTGELKGEFGPTASHLNKQLTLACFKTKAGIEDIRFVLASLDVTPPCASTLYRKCNLTGETVINVNKMAMVENQRLCRKDALEHGKRPEVDVQTDTAFNNRLQGGYEAGTQAFSGVIDYRTGLVLASDVENKLCRKVDCTHESCKRTLDPTSTISSSERRQFERNLEKIEKEGLVTVSSVTTDASSQLEKVIGEINSAKNASGKATTKHYQCLIHRMRCFYKALKPIKLKSLRGKGPKGQFFGTLRRRIYWEVKRGGEKRTSIEKIYRACANSIRCMMGVHTKCRKLSKVCRGNLKHPPRCLPGGRYVTLSDQEALAILAVINNYFSPKCLERLDGRRNTNRCENVHSMIFNYAPKGTTYSRNFGAITHSAIHTKTFGPGRSTMMLAKSMQLLDKDVATPFSTLLKKRDKKANYDARRQQGYKYKTRRYVNLKKKLRSQK